MNSVGTVFDYDENTDEWTTIPGGGDASVVALIHTLKSDPVQHLFFSDWGVSFVDSIRDRTSPLIGIIKTTDRFKAFFNSLSVTVVDENAGVYKIQYSFDGKSTSSTLINIDKYR
jgi:hypothetical protein